jgi:hypothetical protein
MRKIYEILIISIIFFIICFVYKRQQRISLNGGKGWDGIFYYHITEQIQDGTYPVVEELPFVRRLGTPFLIARFSTITGINIMDSALYVNLTGALITVLLLMFWLKKFFDRFWINCLLCFLFMMAWYAPVRFLFYIPVSSDSWGAVWFMISLLILQVMRDSYSNDNHRRFIGWVIAYALVISVGNIFRESNAVLCILPFFILNPIKHLQVFSGIKDVSYYVQGMRKSLMFFFNKRNLILLIPVVSIIFSNAFIRKSTAVSDHNVYSYVDNVFTCFYTKTPPEYILGIFIAFGPLILLVPFFYKKWKPLLLDKQELLALLIISLLFGFIGGTDTERIIFMSGFPVIFLLLGISIKSVYDCPQRWWLYVLFILQSIAFRFYWTLPDYTVKSGHTPVPFFGLMSNHVKYLYLYSHFSNYIVNTILLGEYLMLLVLTWYVLEHKIVLKKAPGTLRNSNH